MARWGGRDHTPVDVPTPVCIWVAQIGLIIFQNKTEDMKLGSEVDLINYIVYRYKISQKVSKNNNFLKIILFHLVQWSMCLTANWRSLDHVAS